MLVAPARDYYNYNYQVQHLSTPSSSRSAQRNIRKRQRWGPMELFLISGILMAFITGMLLTTQAASLAAKGHQLNQLRYEVEELQKSNGLLRLEASRLRSLDRIEKIATTELGMRKPSGKDWELLPGSGRSQTILAEADRPGGEEPSDGGRAPALAVVGRMLARWLGVAGRVEASEI